MFGRRRVASFTTTASGTFSAVFTAPQTGGDPTQVTARILAGGQSARTASFQVAARGSHSKKAAAAGGSKGGSKETDRLDRADRTDRADRATDRVTGHVTHRADGFDRLYREHGSARRVALGAGPLPSI